jgi:hypothetical protein
MPRIQCPDHKDCYIVCPGSGYAFYNSPFGPCVTGCDEAKAGDDLMKGLRAASVETRFYGIMSGVTAGVIAQFATDFSAQWPNVAFAEVRRLQSNAIIRPDRRIVAYWEDVEMAGVIMALSAGVQGLAAA